MSLKPVRKILHIHSGKDGGAERFFVNLANAFGEYGLKQKFVIRPKRSWRREIVDLGQIFEDHNRTVSLSRLLLEFRLNRLVKNWEPDVVMAWMPRASRLIKKWPRPCKIIRLGDLPNNLKHFKNCDVIVGNMPGIETRCHQLGWPRKTAVVSNFAREINLIAVSRAQFDTPEDAFLIAGAGRFVNRKGMDILIQCLQLIPGAYLWLIGEGKEMNSLHEQAQALGVLDRVRFVGWVQEPIHYIAAADAFGMPSRHEPLGNAVLDAWQAKVPVVSTRSEGPSWYMRDGVDGLMVDIDATKAFAQQLCAIRDNKELSDQLVEGGTHRLADWFSKDGIVANYLETFSNILNDPNR